MYLSCQRLSPILSLCIALDIHSTNLPVLAKALVDPIARRLHCMSAGDPSIVSAGLAPPFTLFRTRHSLHHFALYQISQTCWIEGRVTCTSAGDPSIVSAGTTPPAYFVSHKTLSPPLWFMSVLANALVDLVYQVRCNRESTSISRYNSGDGCTNWLWTQAVKSRSLSDYTT